VRGSAGVRLSRVVLVLLLASWGMGAAAQEPLPELTGAVNDFAGVIGQDRERRIDAMSRALLERTGDAVVVATVKTIAPYGDIRAYAVELFENRGRGIGAKGQDNGLLVLAWSRSSPTASPARRAASTWCRPSGAAITAPDSRRASAG
jgi:uncharacterized membrane protein YgcG